MKRVNLIRHLTAHGCYLDREGRSHSIWLNPVTDQSEAVPRHREIKDHLARKICRALSIPMPPG
ncbi:MAG: type II toxin-antitoxin system HicA family toxin [Dehalococcoidia bacterium]